MNDSCAGKRLLFGAVAGLVGTLAITAAMKASKKVAPSSEPPMMDDPAKFIVRKTKEALPEEAREKVPQVVESAAENSLGVAYGMTYGALYAALRPAGGTIWRDGLALGLGNWVIGYLGWLPAAGLMPPPWKQTPQQIAAPIAQHAVYGAATVAVYDWLIENF